MRKLFISLVVFASACSTPQQVTGPSAPTFSTTTTGFITTIPAPTATTPPNILPGPPVAADGPIALSTCIKALVQVVIHGRKATFTAPATCNAKAWWVSFLDPLHDVYKQIVEDSVEVEVPAGQSRTVGVQLPIYACGVSGWIQFDAVNNVTRAIARTSPHPPESLIAFDRQWIAAVACPALPSQPPSTPRPPVQPPSDNPRPPSDQPPTPPSDRPCVIVPGTDKCRPA